MSILSFIDFIETSQRKNTINEAVSMANIDTVAQLVVKYLRKYVGNVYFFPTPEYFTKSGQPRHVGIRFFFKNKSFRLNWAATVNKSVNLHSVDYWDGSKTPQPYASSCLVFDQSQSLVKTLPLLKDFILDEIDQIEGIYIAEQTNNTLTEAVYTENDILKTISNMLHALEMGIQIRQQTLAGGNKKFGPKWNEAQVAVRKLYPSLFNSQPGSKQLVIKKEDVSKIDKQKILDEILGKNETIKFHISPGMKEIVDVPGASDEDLDRLTYEEQLDALKTGMKLLMSNATNAIFLGGRGGTGKTQTVEQMLHDAGKTDGDGYFKVTGSASPPGIYRILFQHKREILLFDDSDAALLDPTGRNLFKAAADTKKIRKIAWLKGGKNYVDPSDYNGDEDEDGDGDDYGEKLPRYFDFSGKIIFISNLPLEKLDPDGALRTRGYVITIDPTNEEIYDFMAKIANFIPLDVDYQLSPQQRREVVDILKTRKVPSKTANLRSLVRGLNTRAGVESQGGSDEEWRKFVKMFA